MAPQHPYREIPRPAPRPLETLTKIAAHNLDGYLFVTNLLSRMVVRMSLQRLIDNDFIKTLFGEMEVTDKAKLLLKHTEKLGLSDLGVLMSQIQEVDALADTLIGTAETMKAYEEWMYDQIRPLVANTWLYAYRPLEYKCPKCGGTLKSFPAVVACDNCKFSIPRFYRGYELTADDIRQLLTFGYTSPIYGFISRNGHKFCDALVLDRNYGVTFAAKAAKIYS